MAIDNSRLLERIKHKKSAYDTKQWDMDRMKNETYISNICLHQPSMMINKSENKDHWTQSSSTIQQFKSK